MACFVRHKSTPNQSELFLPAINFPFSTTQVGGHEPESENMQITTCCNTYAVSLSTYFFSPFLIGSAFSASGKFSFKSSKKLVGFSPIYSEEQISTKCQCWPMFCGSNQTFLTSQITMNEFKFLQVFAYLAKSHRSRSLNRFDNRPLVAQSAHLLGLRTITVQDSNQNSNRKANPDRSEKNNFN